MDVLKIICALCFFASCAKVGYLAQQVPGQLSLFTKARDNKEVLKDQAVSAEYKEKIKKIEEYKKYFFNYFDLKENKTYSKTTFLDRKAVSYLVISSPFNEIKAREECFPFMGCFPYLGFFNRKSAQKYAAKLEMLDWVTWVRPVYAYSTLGYFSDPILSSFFYYDEYQLAELIFHELFHTVFFVKNEVELNENLANFFARKLVVEFFRLNANVVRQKRKKEHQLRQLIVELIMQLNEEYRKVDSRGQAEERLAQFLKQRFMPSIKSYCQEMQMDDCRPIKETWNNASMAAYLTYEVDVEQIEQRFLDSGFSLQEFYFFLQREYKSYKKKGTKGQTFASYFLEKPK